MASYCDRCPDCPGDFDPIEGGGPEPAEFLLIGERPGPTEEDRQRVFVGKTGEELDFTYLPLARLRRNLIHIQNVVRCYAKGNRPPSDKEVASCANHYLPGVLTRVKPSVLVLMGGSAHKIIDVPAGTRRPRVDYLHGRPMYGSVLDGTWEGWIWSSYHPALGMHDTAKMSDLLEDFENLGKWWEGDWAPPTPDGDMKKDYRLVTSPRGVVDYIRQYKQQAFKVAGTDTETHGKIPWSVQVSLADHTGILVRYDDKRTLRELATGMNHLIGEEGWEVAFHNASADIDLCEKAGMVVDGHYRDTMKEAFELCNLPQGLKPLVFRLFGVTMTSWEDVVWPASVEAFSDWAVDAIAFAKEHLQHTVVTEMKTWTCISCGHRAHALGPCKSKAGGRTVACGCEDTENYTNEKREERAGAVERILTHALQHTQATVDADKPYDPWMSLVGTVNKPGMRSRGLRGAVATEEEWRRVEEEVGEMPILGIGNAEIGDAVRYAVSDADHTRQVAAETERRRGDRKWKVYEGDWDR